MAKIKLSKKPNQVYFKTTTHYDLEVDGRSLTVCLETDSNESHIHYKNGDDWSESPPEWILEIGENKWGELIFENTLLENVSGLSVNEGISTDDDEE